MLLLVFCFGFDYFLNGTFVCATFRFQSFRFGAVGKMAQSDKIGAMKSVVQKESTGMTYNARELTKGVRQR